MLLVASWPNRAAEFSRSFLLPEGVDPEHGTAVLKEGVLTMVVPKALRLEERRIPPQRAGEAKA